MSSRLQVEFAGVPFKNPVVMASGTFGFGREYADLFDIEQLGGISSKGLTLNPRSGNEGIRIWETPSGIMNSVGFIPATVSGVMKSSSKFLMVSALAAIGLSTSITDFKKAGLAPMFYGITIDTLVTLTALIVIWCMGLM